MMEELLFAYGILYVGLRLQTRIRNTWEESVMLWIFDIPRYVPMYLAD